MLNSYENTSKIIGYQGIFKILMITLVPAKNHPPQTFLSRVYNNESHDFDEDMLKTVTKMGFIKTPIRSTMSHEPLNNCMICSTHKEEVDKLNQKKLATDFVLNVPKHKNLFAVPE